MIFILKYLSSEKGLTCKRCIVIYKNYAFDIKIVKFVKSLSKFHNWINCQKLLIPGVPSRMTGGVETTVLIAYQPASVNNDDLKIHLDLKHQV